jgi:hypothetical protein
LIQELISGVPAGSRIVVAGLNIDTDHFEPAQGVLKELDIRFSLYYTPEQFAETFAHLAAGDFDVAALLTGTVALDAVSDAFARLGTFPHHGKILLDPTRGASRTQGRLAFSTPSLPCSPDARIGVELSRPAAPGGCAAPRIF